MKVKILIDSASDIDLAEAREMGIELVSMEVRFSDDEVYLDGVDLTKKQFFEKLIESTDLPKTSQINPYCFEQKFGELVKAGFQVVAITLSSKLSGTYRSACSAAKSFAENVFVVDSLNACIGERLLCQHAIKLAGDGLSAKEIAENLEKVKSKINVLAMLDTLLYLKKGGRISAVTALAGQMLSIKPVVGILNGEVKMVGKAMGSKKGNNLLNSLVEKKGIDFNMPLGVVYSGLNNDLLQKYLEDSKALWENKTPSIPVYMIGSTIGTHIGPGAIGVAFFEK